MKNHPHVDLWVERFCHLVAVAASLTMGFLLRFDFSPPREAVAILKIALLIAVIVKLPIFDWVGFYRGLRRYVSLPDLYLVFLGNVWGSAVFAIVAMFLIGGRMPRSILIIDAILCFFATGLIRFSVRICNSFGRVRQGRERVGILIYGAGAAGAELVREIQSDRYIQYEVRGFLDDDPIKQGARILGVPVLGTGRQAAAVINRLDRARGAVGEIIIAMPGASGLQMREALSNCHAALIPCKTIPALRDLLRGKILMAQVRNLSLHDLLGRQPARLDRATVRSGIAGRSVLVTGAAGSIGSELCRQIAQLEPACLVAFDQAESDLFRVENDLRRTDPRFELVMALGDIRDPDRLSEVLAKYRVDSVFHAAAYKHVPMMESNLLEAVRNNILGTWNLACAARDVSSLLMISTDKAVNPICVMGATKRVCERIVTARRRGSSHNRASVRFGNVLGSNGSVVPIFQAQIASGGPVKVTHPDARRYFMTISEAVTLVLEASIQSEGAEIFVLDMGEPIRIVDLAENMVRLAGLTPYEDIDIQFTGLRPGEKLVEELTGRIDGSWDGRRDNVRIIREQPLNWDEINAWMNQLKDLVKARNEGDIVAHLQTLVPEYSPSPHLLPPKQISWSGVNAAPIPICNNGRPSPAPVVETAPRRLNSPIVSE